MAELTRTYRGVRPSRFRQDWDVSQEDEIRELRIEVYEKRARLGLPLFDENNDALLSRGVLQNG